MSHQTIMRLIDQLGVNHDDEVMKWKQKLEESLTLDFLEASKLPLSILFFVSQNTFNIG